MKSDFLEELHLLLSKHDIEDVFMVFQDDDFQRLNDNVEINTEYEGLCAYKEEENKDISINSLSIHGVQIGAMELNYAPMSALTIK